DGVGPSRAGRTLARDTARARSASQPELQELLGKLKAETQRTVADVRRIVYGLQPPTLHEFHLGGTPRASSYGRRIVFGLRPRAPDVVDLVGSLREDAGQMQYESPSLPVSRDAP